MNSTYWLNQIMRTMYTANTFYLGLSSTLPLPDGTGVSEPSGNNYARIVVDCFSEPESGIVNNTEDLVFPKSSGIWFDSTARAKYWVLFDGTGEDAHVLSSGLLDEEKTIEGNTTVTVAATTLSVTITDFQETSD